jgi:Chitobiase/beta-hexosaminidase C-terminal domain
MKGFLCSIFALATVIVPAHAITVTTPANGAQVTSPFSLNANTGTCSSKPAVSMGYSIDSGSTTVVPISFSANVSAAQGAHVLHVKCWGQGVSGVLDLNITVVAAAPVSGFVVQTPTPGQTVSSPFSLSATAAVCSSQAVSAMGYSLDSSSNTTTVNAQSVQAAVVAASGTHTLHIKAWGVSGSSCVTDVAITVGSTTAATPTFSPAPGTFTSAQSVTLSDATAGATIYFTTNGAAPTTSSARYSGPIPVGASAVLEAVAIASGYTNSGMARADYVIKPVTPSAPVIPPNATASSELQALDTWHFNHDAGTPGTAVGASSLVSTPSMSGNARQFDSTFTGTGGEIFSTSYADDTAAMNFVYDGWVWIEAGSSIANLEMDSNQVTANGQTVIYAFQCSAYSQKWEYSGAGGRWVASSQPCNPSKWQANAWHHVQISYSRDNSGNVTYHSVWLDGTEQAINATVPSSFALGWQVGVVQTQFQLDGLGASGSITAYLDNLTIYRW